VICSSGIDRATCFEEANDVYLYIQNVCIRLKNSDCMFCACFLLCMRPRGIHFDHYE
jgi:hypothetical protein